LFLANPSAIGASIKCLRILVTTNDAAALVTSIVLLLGGCGGGGSTAPSPGGQTSRYLYVSAYQFPSPDAVTGEIYGYKFDTGGGGLTAVVGSPFAANTSGAPIAISRDSRFVYSSNYLYSNNQFTNTSLIALSVQADGTLAPVPGSPFATSEPISNVFTNPALDFVYAVSVSSNLTVYSIDPSTGTLTEQRTNPVVGIGATTPLLITPDGQHLYSVLGSGIYEFAIDPASGVLSPLPASPVTAPTSNVSFPAGAALDPSGKFLYVTNATQFTGFGGPMEAWSIDPQSGALSLISAEFQPTAGPQGSIAIDASGKYATVDTPVTSKTGPNCFSVLGIDPATGMLANVTGSPFPDLGGSCGLFAADPSAPYVYAAGQTGIYVYSLDETTGEPSLVTGFASPVYAVSNVVVTH
jgi:6-phosphogluconolactonase (cycloisomerase 2 family)